MRIEPLLLYSYAHIWKLLGTLILAYLILSIVGGTIVTLFSNRFKVLCMSLVTILNLAAIPLYAGGVVWIIMFIICSGHWIGMY